MEEKSRLFDLFDEIPKPTKRDLIAGIALLGNLYLTYEEHRKAQEEQRRQNEELVSIRKLLAEIQLEQQRQAEDMQKERENWEKARESYEENLETLKRTVEEKDKALQETKTRLETQCQAFKELQNSLQDMKNKHISDKKRLKEDLERLKREHEADQQGLERQYQAELEALSKDYAAKETSLRQQGELAVAKTEEKYQEIQQEWAIYQKYKAWIAENSSQILLNQLDCSSFGAFISCCGKKGILRYIFRELASVNLWTWFREDVLVLDEVISCCCTLQHLERVEPKGSYDPICHRKCKDGPATGHIADVVLRGVLEQGEILEDCQSFVELSVD